MEIDYFSLNFDYFQVWILDSMLIYTLSFHAFVSNQKLKLVPNFIFWWMRKEFPNACPWWLLGKELTSLWRLASNLVLSNIGLLKKNSFKSIFSIKDLYDSPVHL